jgi:ABC-type multidrug transport system fused ATPase/permease subunit
MQTSFVLEVAVMFIIPLLAVLIALYLGQRYGIYSIKKSPELQQSAVGSVVGAVFGLLAFVLAFTFQIAANHFDSRKNKLLEEVTNIRTTYLRAGLIDEPICSDTKKLLVDYVDQRVELTRDFSKLSLVQSRSQQIFDTLWSYAELLAKRDRSSEVYSLYTSSVNDIIDNYNQRLTFALEYRISVAVFYALFVILFISMFVLGYQFGISGKGSFKINVAMAIIFAVVMLLIAALDRPELGLVKINHNPLFTLQTQLHMKQVQ